MNTSDPAVTRASRREFCHAAAGFATASSALAFANAALAGDPAADSFQLNYILGSPMYGTAPLSVVLAEVHRIGAAAIDIWPRIHANHREQVDELGHQRVAELLAEHDVQLGAITRYDLGPYRLAEEMPVLRKFGGKLLVCGAKNQPGDTLQARVAQFVESMRPHVAEARRHDLVIGIENHAGSLLAEPDAIRYFADHIDSPNFGLAMAPYHLPQDPQLIADLIEHLGEKLVFFQAWQHGRGCHEKLPKEQELLQLPGRGPLDFRPLLAALAKIRYRGWTEIFMHPVPRGIPIRETAPQVTAEINRAREYLEQCLTANAAGGRND